MAIEKKAVDQGLVNLILRRRHSFGMISAEQDETNVGKDIVKMVKMRMNLEKLLVEKYKVH